MKVVTEGRRLAETTSMKGVPRAMKATRLSLKLLWIVGVLACFSLCLYQTTTLLLEYFTYPTITNVEKRRVDLTAPGAITLPDLVVCNLNPISKRVYTDDNIPSVEEYAQLVENMISENRENLTDEEVADLKEHLLNIRGYYAYLGPEQAKYVGHTKEEFIASCKIIVLLGLDTEEVDCEENGSITLLQHPQYFNCYIISIGMQTAGAAKIGYSVTLFLDNIDTYWHNYFTNPEAFVHGAMVMLQSYNTAPHVIEKGHYASPATQVNLKFNVEEINQLEPPYGECEKRDSMADEMEDSSNTSLEYTVVACVNMAIQKAIWEQCNCSDFTHFMYVDPDPSTRCGLHGKTSAEAIKEALCQRQTLADIPYAELDHCHTPCKQAHYRTFYSQSEWPVDPLTHEFYDIMIRGKPYERHFEKVKSAIDEIQKYDPFEVAFSEDLILNNFVKVKTYLCQQSVFNMTDTPKHTIISLISEMGGTLNFWSGITVILVVEMLDFLIRLVFITDEPKKKSIEHVNAEKISLCSVQSKQEDRETSTT